MALDPWQMRALDEFVAGKNVFVHGAAGSGKTRLLCALRGTLVKAKTPYLVTALTGVAATLLSKDATTLHRALNLGRGTGTVATIAKSLAYQRARATALREAEVLIIDEVSMASAALFDLAEGVARRFGRRPSAPWGGRRVVVCGDFSQLLPVSGRGEPTASLAFESAAWAASAFVVCTLRGSHRQCADTAYRDLLTAVRERRVTDEHMALLRTRVVSGEALEAARRKSLVLFSRNAVSDAYNDSRLLELDAATQQSYETTYTIIPRGRGALSPIAVASVKTFLASSVRAPERLVLRCNARVMLLANVQNVEGEKHPIANGHCGVVIGFAVDNAPIVKFDNGRVWTSAKWKWEFADPEWHGVVEQHPLVLAYAMSTYKAQGLTVPAVTLSLSAREMFAPHKGYVALSRVSKLEDLYLDGAPEKAAFRYDSRVLDFHSNKRKERPT